VKTTSVDPPRSRNESSTRVSTSSGSGSIHEREGEAARRIDLTELPAEIRNFIVQSRLMQWNTVNTYATYSMEEALGLIDEMEPIF
jgi:hypothetical protein